MARRNLRNVDERILLRVIHEGSVNGVNNVSTKKIASALRITEPTIYVHFQNKDNLTFEAYKKALAALYGGTGLRKDEDLQSALERNILILLQSAKVHPEETIYVFNYHHLPGFHSGDPKKSEAGSVFYEALASLWNKGNDAETNALIDQQVYDYAFELMDLFAYEAALGVIADDEMTAKFVDGIALGGLEGGKAQFVRLLSEEEKKSLHK
jgi:AcrR family transcriptional regulator